MSCKLAHPLATPNVDIDMVGNSISRNALFAMIDPGVDREREKKRCPLL